MLVKFSRLKDNVIAHDGQREGDLVIGEIYPVLEIFYKVEGSVYFRICPPYNNTTLLYLENKGHINYNHLGSPAYYDASVFDIVDSGIPPNWSVSRVDNSYFIGSKVWENEAFWESYFDNEIWAVELFEKEIKNIQKFHDIK